MAVYGYYLEGYSNGVFLRQYLEAKTIKALENKCINYHMKNKVANVGWVQYKFSGNKDRKYCKSEYKLLGQYNARAFFEFWD